MNYQKNAAIAQSGLETTSAYCLLQFWTPDTTISAYRLLRFTNTDLSRTADIFTIDVKVDNILNMLKISLKLDCYKTKESLCFYTGI